MSPVSAFTARRARHLLLGVAILSAPVLACFPVAPHAHASTGACTSEPVWHLSNGAVLDTTTQISDSSSNVQSVNYTLKLPPGVSVQGPVVDNAGILSPEDHYSYTSGPPGSYSVGVQAVTGTKPPVNVSANTELVQVTAQKPTAGASGHAGQQLWMQVG